MSKKEKECILKESKCFWCGKCQIRKSGYFNMKKDKYLR